MAVQITSQTIYQLASDWRQYIEREGWIGPEEFLAVFRPSFLDTLSEGDAEDYKLFCAEWERQVRYITSAVGQWKPGE